MEAIFDFKDINRRMNRKPVIAAVEVTENKQHVACSCTICVLRAMTHTPPKIYTNPIMDSVNQSAYDQYADSVNRYNKEKLANDIISGKWPWQSY